jgi:hypothetical protein
VIRNWLASTHKGLLEVGALGLLYAVYEVVRGFGGENWEAAFAHTRAIVDLEQGLGVFVERPIQGAAEAVSGLPALLGIAYIVLHLVGTAAALVWVHRARRDAFPIVRTTLIASTALALVGYVLYPAAPPRLAGLGFADTVTASSGVNMSSEMLGALYNPIAAVPSLHFGYAAIVGVSLFLLARNPILRWAGALYPATMLFIIVATGNHFFFDAFAGAITVAAGYFAARALVAPAPLAGTTLGAHAHA